MFMVAWKYSSKVHNKFQNFLNCFGASINSYTLFFLFSGKRKEKRIGRGSSTTQPSDHPAHLFSLPSASLPTARKPTSPPNPLKPSLDHLPCACRLPPGRDIPLRSDVGHERRRPAPHIKTRQKVIENHIIGGKQHGPRTLNLGYTLKQKLIVKEAELPTNPNITDLSPLMTC